MTRAAVAVVEMAAERTFQAFIKAQDSMDHIANSINTKGA
jgi:hypothetical protein